MTHDEEDGGEEELLDLRDEVALLPPKERRALAQYWIDVFFKGKEMHYGGEIPRHMLTAKAFVDAVEGTSICDGVDEAYYRIGRSEEFDEEDENVADDVRLILQVHGDCAQCGVPKRFAAGMTLMYLELCMGIKRPANATKMIF